MNEDEKIKEQISHTKSIIKEGLESDDDIQLILMRWLDLYQKEKAKNKTLEELLQGKLFELYKYYKDLAGTYQGNCISKDKIKAIRQKLNRIANMEFERHRTSTTFVNICGVEADIIELLEDRNEIY